jgi:phage shock protein A
MHVVTPVDRREVAPRGTLSAAELLEQQLAATQEQLAEARERLVAARRRVSELERAVENWVAMAEELRTSG